MFNNITTKTFGLYFSLYIKSIEGIENLPQNKPFILASNQESTMDGALLTRVILKSLNRRMYFVTQFNVKDRVTRLALYLSKPLLINWIGCIPILRKGGTVDKCIKLLKKGKIIGIFPEGRRNPTKQLLKFKSGVARISLLSGVPIVPVGIINSAKVLPIGKIFPRFQRVIIKIGEPIYPIIEEEYLIEKVKKEIGKLCGKNV